jgi:hypothetical protein
VENRLRTVSCPEASGEKGVLLKTGSRDRNGEIASFQWLFNEACIVGPEDLEGGPMGPYGSAHLYVLNGRYVVMWIAVCEPRSQATVVKWMLSSTDVRTQQEAAAEAAARAEHLFPGRP